VSRGAGETGAARAPLSSRQIAARSAARDRLLAAGGRTTGAKDLVGWEVATELCRGAPPRRELEGAVRELGAARAAAEFGADERVVRYWLREARLNRGALPGHAVLESALHSSPDHGPWTTRIEAEIRACWERGLKIHQWARRQGRPAPRLRLLCRTHNATLPSILPLGSALQAERAPLPPHVAIRHGELVRALGEPDAR